MAGFNSSKNKPSKERKKVGFSKQVNSKQSNVKQSTSPSVPRKPNKQSVGKQSNQKSFNLNEMETSPIKRKAQEEVSDRDLEQLAEKVDLPNYISDVRDCDEKFFIHIINHSKSKDFDPFLIGDFNNDACEIIANSIRESKEELVPSDIVDLSDGNRIRTLER